MISGERRVSRRGMGVSLFAAAIGIGCAAACGSTDGSDAVPACLDQPADATCTNVSYGLVNGQIAPTFHDIFTRTLQPNCGTSPVCHAGSNPQNGLSLDDETKAYQGLMARNAANTGPRVTARDLKCGELIVRLETAGQAWSMPKNSHLPDTDLCVIRHWIANGAKQ